MLPQIIILVLYTLLLGITLAKHGEVKKYEKYNFFTSLLSIIVQIALLYWGGFFDCWFI